MTPDEQAARQQRYRAHMAQDYGINAVGTPGTSIENRVANAAEYAAYQLGQINRNLARLVEHLEKQAK